MLLPICWRPVSRDELEGGRWTPRAESARSDVLLLARAALLHNHARRLAMIIATHEGRVSCHRQPPLAG